MNSRELLLSQPSQAEYSKALANLLAFSTVETSPVQSAQDLPRFLGNIASDFLTVTRATREIVLNTPHIMLAGSLPWNGRFLMLGTESAHSTVSASNVQSVGPRKIFVEGNVTCHMSFAELDQPHLKVSDGITTSPPEEPKTLEQALRAIGIVQELAYGVTEAAPKTLSFDQQ